MAKILERNIMENVNRDQVMNNLEKEDEKTDDTDRNSKSQGL